MGKWGSVPDGLPICTWGSDLSLSGLGRGGTTTSGPAVAPGDTSHGCEVMGWDGVGPLLGGCLWEGGSTIGLGP